jgi:tyrosinase
MTIELILNGNPNPLDHYLTWVPTPCSIRQINGTSDLTVQVRTEAGSQAELSFYRNIGDDPISRLQMTIPADGTPVNFFVSGTFGSTSLDDEDTQIVVRSAGNTLASLNVTVRIRKDANQLTPDERDRFVSAFAIFNDQGMGEFTSFRDMHVNESAPEAHGGSWFLPWHRAYLLDLERELQLIDPSVSLPYWRFDRPAPNLFSLDFIGVSDNGRVVFGQNNPLNFWSTDGVQGITRLPLFNTSTQSASVISEADTLALGGANFLYRLFRRMEGNPHGSAHVSFDGFIRSIHTAARDPLFFLLHCNVDRLWAKWQWLGERFDKNHPSSYDPPPPRPGHGLNDTMWPWNNVTNFPRPNFAPRSPLTDSKMVTAPGLTPEVGGLIDLQGSFAGGNGLGFDYDDVPFE